MAKQQKAIRRAQEAMQRPSAQQLDACRRDAENALRLIEEAIEFKWQIMAYLRSDNVACDFTANEVKALHCGLLCLLKFINDEIKKGAH